LERFDEALRSYTPLRHHCISSSNTGALSGKWQQPDSVSLLDGVGLRPLPYRTCFLSDNLSGYLVMKAVPGVSTASIWSGFWFVFDDAGRRIALWVAPWGKEQLYVNGRLVSQCSRIALSGSHAVSIGDDQYEVTVKVTSVVRGEIDCTLFRNGEFRSGIRDKLALPQSWLGISLMVLIALSGMYAINNGVSIWVVAPMFAALALVAKFSGAGYVFQPFEKPEPGAGT